MLHRSEQTRVTIRKEEAKIRKNVVQVVINLTTFLQQLSEITMAVKKVTDDQSLHLQPLQHIRSHVIKVWMKSSFCFPKEPLYKMKTGLCLQGLGQLAAANTPWPSCHGHLKTANLLQPVNGIFANGNNVEETLADNIYCVECGIVPWRVTPWQVGHGVMAVARWSQQDGRSKLTMVTCPILVSYLYHFPKGY